METASASAASPEAAFSDVLPDPEDVFPFEALPDEPSADPDLPDELPEEEPLPGFPDFPLPEPGPPLPLLPPFPPGLCLYFVLSPVPELLPSSAASAVLSPPSDSDAMLSSAVPFFSAALLSVSDTSVDASADPPVLSAAASLPAAACTDSA